MCQLKTANFANTTELLNIKFLLKQKKYYATFVNEIGLFSLSRISFDGCNQHTHLSFNFTELNENIKVCWKTKLVVIIHENKKLLSQRSLLWNGLKSKQPHKWLHNLLQFEFGNVKKLLRYKIFANHLSAFPCTFYPLAMFILNIYYSQKLWSRKMNGKRFYHIRIEK